MKCFTGDKKYRRSDRSGWKEQRECNNLGNKRTDKTLGMLLGFSAEETPGNPRGISVIPHASRLPARCVFNAEILLPPGRLRYVKYHTATFPALLGIG